MLDGMTRRGFLAAAVGSTVAAAANPAGAMSPIERAAEPRLKLSLVAFSMRRYLTAEPGERGAMDLFGFVDWASQLGFDGVELTSYYWPEQVEPAYVHGLKRHCHVEGMPISAGGIRNNLTFSPGSVEAAEDLAHIERWARHYQRIGTAPIRIFPGTPRGEMRQAPEEQTLWNIIENLRRAGAIGERNGVIMAIENHGYLRQQHRLERVIEAIDSPWVGLTLDSDNWDEPNPYEQFERFAPYAVNVHIKTEITPLGQESQRADLPRLFQALKDGGYRGFVGLEYEEDEEPYERIPQTYEQLRSST